MATRESFFGVYCISLDSCQIAPTVLATSRHVLLPAYTGKAGRLNLNCFESAVGYPRAGGDGVCIDDLSFVWCARSGRGRCA